MSKDNRRRRFKALALFAALMTVVVAFFAGFAVAAARDPANDQHASMPESPGFLPAEGWDVFQTGTTEPPQAPTATASNVPLDPRDEIGGLPHPTLESLGSDGIVIFATFYPAGESENVDRQFPEPVAAPLPDGHEARRDRGTARQRSLQPSPGPCRQLQRRPHRVFRGS